MLLQRTFSYFSCREYLSLHSLRLSHFFFLALLCLLSCTCSAKKPLASDLEESSEIVPLLKIKRSYWPTKQWRTRYPQKVGLSQESLKKIEEYAFPAANQDFDKSNEANETKGNRRTYSLLIIKNGYLVYERYNDGFQKNSLMPYGTIGKCLINTLVGIAHTKGMFNLDDPAYRYYSPLNQPEKRSLTIRHLLHMSSGIKWTERAGFFSIFNPSTLRSMMFGAGKMDMPQFAAQQEQAFLPGIRLWHSSGDSILLMVILRNIVGEEAYANYPWKVLFDAIGMRNVVLEKDEAGNYIASSYFYTTSRDLAKYGFLYLNSGHWEGKTILGNEWLKMSRTVSPSYRNITEDQEYEKQVNMSAHWYVNRGIPAVDIRRPIPSAPNDVLTCRGSSGARLHIIPSWDMIIVRGGHDKEQQPEHGWDDIAFFEAIKGNFESPPIQ